MLHATLQLLPIYYTISRVRKTSFNIYVKIFIRNKFNKNKYIHVLNAKILYCSFVYMQLVLTLKSREVFKST